MKGYPKTDYPKTDYPKADYAKTRHAPLATKERKELFKITSATPRKVEALLRQVAPEQLTRRPRQGFSLHEHAWHLTDLETEGFKQRLRAVLTQNQPALPDFNGDAVAAVRDYHRLPLQQALKIFSETRLENLWLLSGISHADWMRSGVQAGVGEVCVVDIFRAMAAHDLEHLQQMQKLVNNEDVCVSSSTAAA